jgi:dipeptidyl-peptidase 4
MLHPVRVPPSKPDNNVDPASTAQVVSALQKADKDFDFLPIMNAGHGAAETPYGKYRRAEFLMRNLGVLR